MERFAAVGLVLLMVSMFLAYRAGWFARHQEPVSTFSPPVPTPRIVYIPIPATREPMPTPSFVFLQPSCPSRAPGEIDYATLRAYQDETGRGPTPSEAQTWRTKYQEAEARCAATDPYAFVAGGITDSEEAQVYRAGKFMLKMMEGESRSPTPDPYAFP